MTQLKISTPHEHSQSDLKVINLRFVLAASVYFTLFFFLAFLLQSLWPGLHSSSKQMLLYVFLINTIPLSVAWYVYYKIRPRLDRPNPPASWRLWLRLVARVAIAFFVYLIVLYGVWWMAHAVTQECLTVQHYPEALSANPYLVHCRVLNWLGQSELVVRMLLIPQNPTVVSLIPLGVFWATFYLTRSPERQAGGPKRRAWQTYLTGLMVANVLAIVAPWGLLAYISWANAGFMGLILLPYTFLGVITAILNVFSIVVFLLFRKPSLGMAIGGLVAMLASISYVVWLAFLFFVGRW